MNRSNMAHTPLGPQRQFVFTTLRTVSLFHIHISLSWTNQRKYDDCYNSQ